ncbi:hypothetical protein [Deinococcus sp.]|uniref:hypothetical protein n=1 Tax=Deinococcus sp. TaxID=47478 RepID=UPI0025FF2C50|nr:hypothetical protein [Deinococcus sp.]
MQVSSSVNRNATDVTFDCQTGKVLIQASGRSVGLTTSSLPDAGRWTVGYTWRSAAQVGAVSVSSENRIVAAERVTTPAGSFEALKVEITARIDMSTLMGGQKLPPEVMKKVVASFSNVKSSAWYVRLVRQGRGRGAERQREVDHEAHRHQALR